MSEGGGSVPAPPLCRKEEKRRKERRTLLNFQPDELSGGEAPVERRNDDRRLILKNERAKTPYYEVVMYDTVEE